MKPATFLFFAVLFISLNSQAQQKAASGKKPATTNKPAATAQDPKASNNLSALKKMKDEYRSIEISNRSLKPRIMKLVGDRYNFMKKLSDSGGPASAVDVKDDIYSGFLCKAHDCGDNNFIVAGDLKNNVLHIGIREKGKAQIYSENNAPVPQVVTDWLNNKN